MSAKFQSHVYCGDAYLHLGDFKRAEVCIPSDLGVVLFSFCTSLASNPLKNEHAFFHLIKVALSEGSPTKETCCQIKREGSGFTHWWGKCGVLVNATAKKNAQMFFLIFLSSLGSIRGRVPPFRNSVLSSPLQDVTSENDIKFQIYTCHMNLKQQSQAITAVSLLDIWQL